MRTESSQTIIRLKDLTSDASGCALTMFSIVAICIYAPAEFNVLLTRVCDFILENFRALIIWTLAACVLSCLLITAKPQWASRKLGRCTDLPEHSWFSWIAMIFGAGMGVGMLTWGVSEPLSELGINPDTIQGLTTSGSDQDAISALKWSYLHWGLAAWSCYSIVGLGIAYNAHRKDLPLVLSTAFTPLTRYGGSKFTFRLIDILFLVITLLCVIQTLGFAIENLVICLARTFDCPWLLDSEGTALPLAKTSGIFLIMGISCLSAASGTLKGLKWISNINLGLSLTVLALLVFLFDLFPANLSTVLLGTADYLTNLPSMMFKIWNGDGTDIGDKLKNWQGTWSLFHWAWWMAFAPFAGAFLARISKGRSVREYIIATIIIPTCLCILWLTLAGGTAISLESSGTAHGAIAGAEVGEKFFVMLRYATSPLLGWIVAATLVVLLTTFIITTIDSALVVTVGALDQTDSGQRPVHLFVICTGLLTLAIVLLVWSDGMAPIRTSMIVSVLPMTGVVALSCVSVFMALSDKQHGRHYGQ